MKPILGNDEGSAVQSPRDVRAACTAAGLMRALAQCLLECLTDNTLSTPALTSVGAQMRHFDSILRRGCPAAGERHCLQDTTSKYTFTLQTLSWRARAAALPGKEATGVRRLAAPWGARRMPGGLLVCASFEALDPRSFPPAAACSSARSCFFTEASWLSHRSLACWQSCRWPSSWARRASSGGSTP
jgi:hypothetical protein